jgi:DNA-binding LytR/AlgR family response regulator
MKAFERALKSGQINRQPHEGAPGDQEFLFVKVNGKFIKILTSEILYIESLKDYIKVVTPAHSWISYQTLSSITEKLRADQFMRIHRSFTIAIDKVDAIEGNCVTIASKQIPVSRECRQEALKRIRK